MTPDATNIDTYFCVLRRVSTHRQYCGLAHHMLLLKKSIITALTSHSNAHHQHEMNYPHSEADNTGAAGTKGAALMHAGGVEPAPSALRSTKQKNEDTHTHAHHTPPQGHVGALLGGYINGYLYIQPQLMMSLYRYH